MNYSNKYSYGLTIFRILICFVIIKNMCFYLPMADDFFGPNAFFPYINYLEQMHFFNLKYLIFPFNIPYLSQLYLIIVIVLASMYMVAIGKRYVGFLLYISIIILKIRNGFILDGSDNVIQVTLLYLVISDNLEHFRYFDSKKEKRGNLTTQISLIATYALMIQICFVYFFTSLAKHQGDLWQNGTAVYYTMRVRDFMATDWNIPLTRNHYFVVFSTYLTLFWETAFSFLIWFKKTKFYIIIGGIILHLGIWLFMRIDNFSWVMISTYFVFITNYEYNLIAGYSRKLFIKNKLTIYIDGWCPTCQKFGSFISKLDFFNLLILKDIRLVDKEIDIDKEKAVKIMVSKNSKGVIYYGYDSIFQIFIRLPFSWILVPFMYLIKFFSIGNYLYGELALNRKIIPIHCSNDCNINQ